MSEKKPLPILTGLPPFARPAPDIGVSYSVGNGEYKRVGDRIEASIPITIRPPQQETER